MEGRGALLDRTVGALYPGSFNLVMATGIVSNGFFLLGRHTLSSVLLAVALVAYPCLFAALVLRALLYPRRLGADLVDPRLVFTFFTLVAGTDVLGLGLHLRGHDRPAVWLWLFALVVWTLLGYFSFSVLSFVNTESGAEVVHGGWLIAIVGTESLVILGITLAPRFGSLEDLTLFAVYGGSESSSTALAADYTPLQTVSRTMIWVALAAWLATAAGLAGSLRSG